MAASVLRKFGFKKHQPRESEARQNLQKELFAFNHCVEHGFPHKPTCLAYDSKLKLLAIGTKTGAVKVLGRPGVEYSGQHNGDHEVNKLFFLPEQARLISLCSDNSLHLWEINTRDGAAVIEEVRSISMDTGKLKAISTCCLSSNADRLLIGTEGGNIHVLNLPEFKLNEHIIYQDVVMQNVPDDFKVNPGPVESIAQHPSKPEKFLIGYNRGLVVLWDNNESAAELTFSPSQQLESVAWHRDGQQFMTAHADGSYIVWSTANPATPKEQATTPYGPFPCKAINKIQWRTAKSDPFIIFSGGMPRASYGDRHTVSAMQGSNHSVFDFSSKVLDFVSICSADELEDYDRFEYDDPHSLIVLTEEEIVAIDLQTEGWPCFKLPYLNSLHASAITCVSHVTNIPDSLWSKICDAGDQQFSNNSTRDWPVTGGQTLPQTVATKDLLLTGHEDGSVRFWDVTSVAQRLLYTVKTGPVFGVDMGPQENAEDEEWPPFKKVGMFDPYSDDPRLGIQKIILCPVSETMVVAGTAGQIVIMQFEREERELEVKVTEVNIVSDRDGFVWKGHEAPPVRGGEVKFSAGFQPVSVMQLSPPAACTALAMNSEWQLVTAGTAHGFGVFDYNQRVEVTTKCTLNPADLTGTGESAMSRRKSFKKSLRESFRRLRRGRSGRKQSPKHQSPKASPKKSENAEKVEGIEVKSEEAAAVAAPPTTAAAAATESGGASADAEAAEGSKPVERAVEARAEKAATEEMASMVRCLYFADTFLINAQNHSPTLWAGTNGGAVFIYQITVPANDKRDVEPTKCQLGKEIQLKHRAPVINMAVVDSQWHPLPGAFEVEHERAKAPDMAGGHHVVICSEEQFKVFDLPSLKAKSHKYKLTATEGSKVRRVAFVQFRSKSDERYHENDLAVLTNQGDVQVYTVPGLKRQMKTECVRKENVSGIVASVFTLLGEGFYLESPSQFGRFSLSARIVNKPACEVLLKDGIRPALPEPEPEPEEPKAEEVVAPTEEEAANAISIDTAVVAIADAGEAIAYAEAAPTEGKESEEAAKPEDAESPMDQSNLTLESANDSVALADTTGDITVDSIRVHLSESRIEEGSTHVVSSESSSVTRTIVTKTVVSETTGDGETVTHETTTVSHTASEDPGAAGAGDSAAAIGSGDNLDDDSKCARVAEETEAFLVVVSEGLGELHITEEGEEEKQPIDQTQPISDKNDVEPHKPVVIIDETIEEPLQIPPQPLEDDTDGNIVDAIFQDGSENFLLESSIIVEKDDRVLEPYIIEEQQHKIQAQVDSHAESVDEPPHENSVEIEEQVIQPLHADKQSSLISNVEESPLLKEFLVKEEHSAPPSADDYEGFSDDKRDSFLLDKIADDLVAEVLNSVRKQVPLVEMLNTGGEDTEVEECHPESETPPVEEDTIVACCKEEKIKDDPGMFGFVMTVAGIDPPAPLEAAAGIVDPSPQDGEPEILDSESGTVATVAGIDPVLLEDAKDSIATPEVKHNDWISEEDLVSKPEFETPPVIEQEPKFPIYPLSAEVEGESRSWIAPEDSEVIPPPEDEHEYLELIAEDEETGIDGDYGEEISKSDIGNNIDVAPELKVGLSSDLASAEGGSSLCSDGVDSQSVSSEILPGNSGDKSEDIQADANISSYLNHARE